MRILLSDMAPQARTQLRYVLQHEPWVTAVEADVPEPAYDDPGGSYEPYPAAIGAIDAVEGLTARAGAMRADVVLLDWDLAAPLPAGTLESLKSSFPQIVVAALSARPDERAAALAAGIDLFIPSNGAAEDIVASLRATLATPRHDSGGQVGMS